MADDIVTRIAEHPHYSEYDATDCLRCAAADEIERLNFERDEHRDAARAYKDEIERLRRLGDTLAYHVRAGEAKEMYSAVHAWEEARRG